MKSNNPIFRRSEEFNGPSANAYGNQTYAGGGRWPPGYGQQTADPSTCGHRDAGRARHRPGQVDEGRMTVDSVVQKTAITLFVVVLTAAATWYWTGDAITEKLRQRSPTRTTSASSTSR